MTVPSGPDKPEAFVEGVLQPPAGPRRRRTFVAVERLAVLGHQVQEEQRHVQPEQPVIPQFRMAQPGRDILNGTAMGGQRGQGQRGGIARADKAEIVDIDDSRYVAPQG